MESETITTAAGGTGAIAMLGLLLKSVTTQNKGLHSQLAQERESCTTRIEKLEARMDRERESADERSAKRDTAINAITEKLDRCEEAHASSREHVAVLANEIKAIRRSITPQPMPKVTP